MTLNTDPFHIWAECPAHDWRDAVALLVEAAYPTTETRVNRLFAEWEKKLRKECPHFDSFAMDSAFTAAQSEALRFGALLGYALAKTEPCSIMKFDGWLERAGALAGPAEDPADDGDVPWYAPEARAKAKRIEQPEPPSAA